MVGTWWSMRSQRGQGGGFAKLRLRLGSFCGGIDPGNDGLFPSFGRLENIGVWVHSLDDTALAGMIEGLHGGERNAAGRLNGCHTNEVRG